MWSPTLSLDSATESLNMYGIAMAPMNPGIVLDCPVDCSRLAWRYRSPGPELGVGRVKEVPDTELQVGPGHMYAAGKVKQGVRRQLYARLIEWGVGSHHVGADTEFPPGSLG